MLPAFSIGELIKKSCISVCAAFLCALSMNLFLVPAHVYAAGINGAAQLISDILFDGLNLHLSIGLLILVLNLPIAVLGWYKVGKSFTLFSFITVMLTSLFLTVLPVHPLSSDILLNSIFGGMISAIGVGIALKYGISTGGLDIIAIFLTRRNRNASSGKYFLILNGIIIVIAGAVYEWQYALYTLISRFVNSYVIDMIHTKYQKLTVMTITDQSDRLVEAIQDQFDRGMTVIPSYGGFTGTKKSTLMMVISHYELYKMERLIKSIEPNAFTNILETNKIIGTFHTEEQQRAIQAMKHGEHTLKVEQTLGPQDYERFQKLFGTSIVK
ncbi:YitT family protein [Sporolactobacillus sp. STSJ-5]|uniref:YitT family protein n=1 Tax=Sporolactobacillus sp. STSJ-5 TaxID=2965076 RepID=UPI002104ADD8|nr:YitT family protein [Sporolactobacillus sp. STSJ-5]MCQ2011642.1 YitT family protein [Sporolactobacillus sp. STSJ-5]